MKKPQNIQVSYRFPEPLVVDLREVAEIAGIPQSLIVREGLKDKLRRLKACIRREKEFEKSA